MDKYISFNQFTFQYDAQAEATLKDISFDIVKGGSLPGVGGDLPGDNSGDEGAGYPQPLPGVRDSEGGGIHYGAAQNEEIYGGFRGDIRRLPAVHQPGGYPCVFHRRVLHLCNALFKYV